jgi:hypothetical protein
MALMRTLICGWREFLTMKRAIMSRAFSEIWRGINGFLAGMMLFCHCHLLCLWTWKYPQTRTE